MTPLPIPTSPPDRPDFVLLFGGTFDPPHKGHVDLPLRVRSEIERRSGQSRGWTLYVPAARSPHKSAGPVASDQDRVAMLKLAIGTTPRTEVWTDEIDRAAPGDPSFTVDTLRRARTWLDDHQAAGVSLRLLIGADQALKFHQWRDPRDILRVARPVVMLRGDHAGAATLLRKLGDTNFWEGPELQIWRDAIIPIGRIDISATQVRDALRFGDEAALLNLVPRPVIGYIRERGLYATV